MAVSVTPGDLVSVPFQISCGACDRCRRGQTGNCESVDFLSTYGLPLGPDNGGFVSERSGSRTPRRCCSRSPTGSSPAAVASLSDNIPDAWRTVGPQLDAEPGAAVLICAGAGSIPVYAAALAIAKGAERVDFAGGRPHEREVAARLGAKLLDEEFPKRLGPYPITVAGAARTTPASTAPCARPSPTASAPRSRSSSAEQTPMPLLEMYTRGSAFTPGAATPGRRWSRSSS